MKATPERGYPYPECDPPLTKDASDIIQLRNLATAVDTDVQAIYDRAADAVVLPDSARSAMSASVSDTLTPADISPFFGARTFDTSPGLRMTPTTEGIMRLIEPGWYSVGAYALFTSATYLGLRIRFDIDGVAATSFCPQAEIGLGNVQAAGHTAEIFNPSGNVELSLVCRLGAAAASYSYTARIWAVQTVRL